MRKLEVSNQSKQEIINIKVFTTLNWGKKQSNKYIIELYNKLSLLVQNPLIGINRVDLSKETYSFPHESHMIYYKFNENYLYVMAVLHQNMLPKEQLKGRI